MFIKTEYVDNVETIIVGELPEGVYWLCHRYEDFDKINGILGQRHTVDEDEHGNEVHRDYLIKLVSDDDNACAAFPESMKATEELTLAMVAVEGGKFRYLGHHPIPKKLQEPESLELEIPLLDEVDFGI